MILKNINNRLLITSLVRGGEAGEMANRQKKRKSPSLKDVQEGKQRRGKRKD